MRGAYSAVAPFQMPAFLICFSWFFPTLVLPRQIVAAELGGKRSAAKVVEGASAVVFCASGFAQNLSPIQRCVHVVHLLLLCGCGRFVVAVSKLITSPATEPMAIPARLMEANCQSLQAGQRGAADDQS